jgi:integrase
MSASIVKRGEGRYNVVVEEGNQASRRCVAGCKGGRVWVNDGPVETCPKCGGPLGDIVHERRQRWHGPYKRRRDAEAAASQLDVQRQQGTYVEPDKMTVTEWFATWIGTLDLRPSTIKSYTDTLRLYVEPDLGAIRLQKLTTAAIDQCYARLRAEGRLGARSIRYVHTVLKSALTSAVRKNLMVRNPADQASPPPASAARPPEMTVWSPSETAAFLGHEAVRADRLAALWRLAVASGVRRGELLGARWSDLAGDRLSIRRQVITVDGLPVLADVKTGNARRSVALDSETVSALRAHRVRQNEERLACGAGYRDDGLMFPNPDGTPILPTYVSRRFAQLVRDIGAPKIRLHDLRHSHASHLIAAGVHPKAVAGRLGHASATFTMDRYGHLLEGLDAGAADAAAALIDEAST